jgi:hypothetical protein
MLLPQPLVSTTPPIAPKNYPHQPEPTVTDSVTLPLFLVLTCLREVTLCFVSRPGAPQPPSNQAVTIHVTAVDTGNGQ